MFEVKTSPLHGKGLFAREFIPQDTIIGSLVYQPADPNNLEHWHVLWLDEDTPVRVMCDMKYINHHHQPNAAYFEDGTVVAICDIAPGQEITHDYSGEGLEHFFDA